MEIFFSIFMWFWFSVFLEFVLVSASVTFWYFFSFVKSECGGMLALHLWKGLLCLTRSSWAFFIGGLQTFYRHLNIILVHFYWLLILLMVSHVLWKPVIWLLLQFNRLVTTWCKSFKFFNLTFFYMFYIYCFYSTFICSFVVFKLFRLDLLFKPFVNAQF